VRIAALNDIHGNVDALDAVLGEVARLGVDAVVVGGDVVAGPFPREVLDRLRALACDVRWVRGNADREVVELIDRRRAPDRSPGPADAWVAGRLRTEDRDLLDSFADTVSVEVDGLGRTLFCHGSPRSDEEMLTRATAGERLRRILADVEERVVVCGHTHVQFDRRVDGIRVVNAGSVGMPYADRPGAYWALLGPDVDLRHTVYDLERAAARVRATAWPGAEEFARENLLTVPTAEEATELFERMAIERDAAAGR
jgi:predicted phosphodiesterase